MLGVLLETKAARQHKSGSAVLSTLVHTAIIGVVAMATTARRHPPAHAHDLIHRPVFVTPVIAHSEATTRESGPAVPLSLPVIRAPNLVPRFLPPVHPTAVPTEDPSDIIIGSLDRSGTTPRGVLDLGGIDANDGTSWSGGEALMHIRTAATPAYPETLRRVGVSGRVVLRFVVDTTGRVDLASVQVLESTDDAFTRSVREILPRLRFEPSRVNGRAVTAMAEMPFEFVLK